MQVTYQRRAFAKFCKPQGYDKPIKLDYHDVLLAKNMFRHHRTMHSWGKGTSIDMVWVPNGNVMLWYNPNQDICD